MLVQRHRKLIMTKCPACGADLTEEKRTSSHFFDEHLPEDFGLSPLRREADAR